MFVKNAERHRKSSPIEQPRKVPSIVFANDFEQLTVDQHDLSIRLSEEKASPRRAADHDNIGARHEVELLKNAPPCIDYRCYDRNRTLSRE
jgi:hypothetical protein